MPHVLLPSLHPSSQKPVSQIRPHPFFPHLLNKYREGSSLFCEAVVLPSFSAGTTVAIASLPDKYVALGKQDLFCMACGNDALYFIYFMI